MARMHLPQHWFKVLFQPKDKRTSEPHDLKDEDDSRRFDEAVTKDDP